MKSKSIGIGMYDAIPYAVAVAIGEAVAKGHITEENATALEHRADVFLNALLNGKVLRRGPDGVYEIIERSDMPANTEVTEVSALVGEAGALTVGGDDDE